MKTLPFFNSITGDTPMSEQGTPSESGRYWAFISYSQEDESWASWLHQALETYRLPRGLTGHMGKYGELPQRLFPVFRDREELASAADLPARISEVLPITGGAPVLSGEIDDYSAFVGTAFTPDGQVLIASTGSYHGYFRLDRCVVSGNSEKTQCEKRELLLNPYPNVKAFFSANGRMVAISVEKSDLNECTIRVWDTMGAGESVFPGKRVNDLVLAPDLKHLFLAHMAGGAVEVIDAAGRNLRTLTHEG
jgi:hypothetical protein